MPGMQDLADHNALVAISSPHTPGPSRRACFIRHEMGKFRAQAAFNRSHYSEAEAFCWEDAAADCLHALGGIAGNWQQAIDEGAAKATGSAA